MTDLRLNSEKIKMVQQKDNQSTDPLQGFFVEGAKLIEHSSKQNFRILNLFARTFLYYKLIGKRSNHPEILDQIPRHWEFRGGLNREITSKMIEEIQHGMPDERDYKSQLPKFSKLDFFLWTLTNKIPREIYETLTRDITQYRIEMTETFVSLDDLELAYCIPIKESERLSESEGWSSADIEPRMINYANSLGASYVAIGGLEYSPNSSELAQFFRTRRRSKK